ncbi:unnamed protein product, partial [Ceratitis capitata]
QLNPLIDAIDTRPNSAVHWPSVQQQQKPGGRQVGEAGIQCKKRYKVCFKRQFFHTTTKAVASFYYSSNSDRNIFDMKIVASKNNPSTFRSTSRELTRWFSM